MSQQTGGDQEAAKPDLRVEDPSDRDEMDSILLLATRAVNRLGQSGTAAREALQKLVQAVADVSWQQQEAPKSVAVAAASVSGKSCRYICQEGHKLEDCPKFLQLLPNFRHLMCMRCKRCLSCLEERQGKDLTAVGAKKGEQSACRQGGSKCEKCSEWHHPLPKCPKYRPL